ncbi:hypothetical protein BC827DRAFT_392573 [Russula dissimulans]|nr:hypothetical protein BC827DRAFT_392573 [Russula dissimulans]
MDHPTRDHLAFHLRISLNEIGRLDATGDFRSRMAMRRNKICRSQNREMPHDLRNAAMTSSLVPSSATGLHFNCSDLPLAQKYIKFPVIDDKQRVKNGVSPFPRFHWFRLRLVYQPSYSEFQNKTNIQEKTGKGTGVSTEGGKYKSHIGSTYVRYLDNMTLCTSMSTTTKRGVVFAPSYEGTKATIPNSGAWII